jgi:hypothetical protein
MIERLLQAIFGRPAKQQPMWEHFCQSEHDVMCTAVGEECSWCGQREGDR